MKLAGSVALQQVDAARVKVWLQWTGRILSTFGVLICLSSIFAKLTHEANYVGQWDINWPRLLSMSVLSVIPMLLVFLALQRFFMSGLLAGAVKE